MPREYLEWQAPPGYRTQDLDTSPQVERLLFDLSRQMPTHERVRKLRSLNVGLATLALSAIRRKHPEAIDEELRMYLASRWLDRETMIQAYNGDPAVRGF